MDQAEVHLQRLVRTTGDFIGFDAECVKVPGPQKKHVALVQLASASEVVLVHLFLMGKPSLFVYLFFSYIVFRCRSPNVGQAFRKP